MSTSTEPETRPSRELLQSYKGETCPSCKTEHLYTNDSDKFDDIVNYVCMACGYGFYEDEQSRKQRKEKKKRDNDRNLWNGGVLVFFAMIATILLINLERSRAPITDVRSEPTQINRRF